MPKVSDSLDALTGVADLRFFREALSAESERSRRYARPFVLAYLDVDNFKSVNDTNGHKAGDNLLRRIARSVQSHVRSPDLLARVGGDEFTLLMPETEAEAGEVALAKIRAALTAEFAAATPPVSFSVGLLACHDPAGDANKLLHVVDTLMYKSKRSGGDAIRARALSRDKQQQQNLASVTAPP